MKEGDGVTPVERLAQAIKEVGRRGFMLRTDKPNRALAPAILAALPNGCLHDDCVSCAKEVAEAALPEGWVLSLSQSLYFDRWIAIAAGHFDSVSAEGATAGSALNALATELRGRQE